MSAGRRWGEERREMGKEPPVPWPEEIKPLGYLRMKPVIQHHFSFTDVLESSLTATP